MSRFKKFALTFGFILAGSLTSAMAAPAMAGWGGHYGGYYNRPYRYYQPRPYYRSYPYRYQYPRYYGNPWYGSYYGGYPRHHHHHGGGFGFGFQYGR